MYLFLIGLEFSLLFPCVFVLFCFLIEFSFPLCFLSSGIWRVHIPPLASLTSKVQRKPGGGGKTEEVGALSWRRSGREAELSSASRVAARERRLLWLARLLRCARLGPTASPRSPGTGRPGELRAHGAPCAASPSQLSSLRPPRSRQPLRTLHSQGVCSPGQEVGAGSPTRLQLRLSTSEPRWLPDARPECAARCPILSGLKQSRNPALRAINPQPQLRSNPSSETSSGRVGPDRAGNLPPLPY